MFTHTIGQARIIKKRPLFTKKWHFLHFFKEMPRRHLPTSRTNTPLRPQTPLPLHPTPHLKKTTHTNKKKTVTFSRNGLQDGARGGTRTPTDLSTCTSSMRVCHFTTRAVKTAYIVAQLKNQCKHFFHFSSFFYMLIEKVSGQAERNYPST